MIFVDTGFLLAFAQPTDALHRRAVEWAATLTEPLLLTEYVLCETVNSLSKRADRPRAHLICRLRMLTVDEARAGLSQWLERALAGEEIRIRQGDALVELPPAAGGAAGTDRDRSPVAAAKPRRAVGMSRRRRYPNVLRPGDRSRSVGVPLGRAGLRHQGRPHT